MENIVNLHLVWLGGNHNQNCIENIRQIDNSCNIMLWLEDSILYPKWKKIYNQFAKTFQMKSDLLRLSALRKFGGLYIDFDCSIMIPINNIIKEWNILTLPTLSNTLFFMGDIIYCPLDWNYWHFIDEYIENFTGNKLAQVSFGNLLFSSLPRHTIQPVIDTIKFPSYPTEMTNSCQICRYPINQGNKI
jgi:hypothetical protein